MQSSYYEPVLLVIKESLVPITEDQILVITWYNRVALLPEPF